MVEKMKEARWLALGALIGGYLLVIAVLYFARFPPGGGYEGLFMHGLILYLTLASLVIGVAFLIVLGLHIMKAAVSNSFS